MKTCFLFLFFLIAGAGRCLAQIKATRLTAAQLPKGIRYHGQLVQALRWTDQQGSHVLVATETGEIASVRVPGQRSMGVFAQHWRVQNQGVVADWHVTDGEKDCPVDVAANFIPGTLAVTDLNHDGVGEVWLMYTTACRGDVSPSALKIMMYQGSRKYAMRGQSKVQVSATEYEGGAYKFDYAFQTAPPPFRAYAQALWRRHCK